MIDTFAHIGPFPSRELAPPWLQSLLVRGDDGRWRLPACAATEDAALSPADRINRARARQQALARDAHKRWLAKQQAQERGDA